MQRLRESKEEEQFRKCAIANDTAQRRVRKNNNRKHEEKVIMWNRNTHGPQQAKQSLIFDSVFATLTIPGVGL
jgi:hypothetical protein